MERAGFGGFKMPTKAFKEYYDYEICGHGRVWDPMTGLEEFCILPVGHSGDHDYRADTGPWDE
jgi:hypothetical protein